MDINKSKYIKKFLFENVWDIFYLSLCTALKFRESWFELAFPPPPKPLS